MSRVLIIGGGAAGMMAAAFCAANGHQVFLYEKNEKLGKKIYITGKGRCNLTNACGPEEFFRNVVTNPRFLYSAFHGFNNDDTVAFFHSIGLETKVERGQRVFPMSDHSSDVIRVLENELRRRHVEVNLRTEVTDIFTENGRFCGIELNGKKRVKGDACIIATGGLSYPSTGSTGDGYRFAKQLGHTVTPLSPSLVSIRLASEYCKRLEGLSLKNVSIKLKAEEALCREETLPRMDCGKGAESKETVKSGKKKNKKCLAPGSVLYEDFGEMIFTAHGVSGPVILSASSYLAPYLKKYAFSLHIDLKPALSNEQLDARILRDFDESKNKQYKNVLEHLLPQKLIGVIIELSEISPEKQVNAISKEERKRLACLLKDFSFPVRGMGDYTEAVITKGGIEAKEVNPSTMESKLAQGVYFAGEVLDVDALTGGFNLQIAWSSGWLAANSIPAGQEGMDFE